MAPHCCTAFEDDYTFEDFLADHGKGYDDPEEYRRREGFFLDNLYDIKRFNSDKTNSYRKVGRVVVCLRAWAYLYRTSRASFLPPSLQAVNKFADWSREEFGRLLGYRWNNRQRNVAAVLNASERPEVVDWREKSLLTEVKNQGACGEWGLG
jgi:hypothetical protein